MSACGTFETWRPALTMSVSGEDQKKSADDRNDAIDSERDFNGRLKIGDLW
jgi:hypothetical protein